jgi:hypothetical protein
MGGSRWSDDHYSDRVAHRVATATPTFKHDVDVKAGRVATAIHPTLNPKGIKVREARDSIAHPNSKPVAVFFDVTGSMHSVPGQLQRVLPKLMALLLQKNYIVDPQILMGAIGDYNGNRPTSDGHWEGPGDRAPLQAGQFESGIEMEDNLTNMFLEGGGGGQSPPQESYQLAWYFAARKTVSDAFEKRNEKGYLFTIGDERPYSRVTKAEVDAVFGDKIEGDIMTAQLLQEAQERWELFHIIPEETSHGKDPSLAAAWAALLGVEHVIRIGNAENICEVIGSTIGLMEGSVEQDKLADDLTDTGTSAAAASSVVSALDGVAKSALAKRGVATAAKGGGSKTIERL